MALRQVRVLNAVDGILSGSYVNGAQAIAYLNTAATSIEIATFSWGSLTIERAFGPGDLTWLINLDTSFPPSLALSDGVYVTKLAIEDVAGNITESDPLTITVQNSPISSPSLTAPTLPGNTNSIINKATADAGFKVNIPAQTTLDGAAYTLYLRLIQLNGTFIGLHVVGSGTLVAAATEVQVAAGASYLQGLDGVNGFFYYVTSGTVSGTSYSKQVYIDTVPPGSL